MSPLKTSNPTIVGPKKCNVVKVQVNYFKRAFMNMIQVLKEEMNTSLNEISEKYKQQNEIGKKVHNLKVEIESRKKTQTEGQMEASN